MSAVRFGRAFRYSYYYFIENGNSGLCCRFHRGQELG